MYHYRHDQADTNWSRNKISTFRSTLPVPDTRPSKGTTDGKRFPWVHFRATSGCRVSRTVEKWQYQSEGNDAGVSQIRIMAVRLRLRDNGKPFVCGREIGTRENTQQWKSRAMTLKCTWLSYLVSVGPDGGLSYKTQCERKANKTPTTKV